ncbi:MAG: hypothetical protein NTV33_12190 [Coprothermobacterota bacterium]|nr:hypothetical protein [Coprothermobacterota bacterium]
MKTVSGKEFVKHFLDLAGLSEEDLKQQRGLVKAGIPGAVRRRSQDFTGIAGRHPAAQPNYHT